MTWCMAPGAMIQWELEAQTAHWCHYFCSTSSRQWETRLLQGGDLCVWWEKGWLDWIYRLNSWFWLQDAGNPIWRWNLKKLGVMRFFGRKRKEAQGVGGLKRASDGDSQQGGTLGLLKTNVLLISSFGCGLSSWLQGLFASCREWGLFLLAVCGFLIMAASPSLEHRL